MMAEDHLNVWFNKELVGKLWANAAGFIGFAYEARWLDSGFSISQQLPLSQQEYSPDSGLAHQFFVNLLPEASARTHIVRDLKIADSDFELLKAVGGECAGALSILPANLVPDEKYHYKKLSREQFHQILLRKGVVFNFYSNEERPRLSLAGAQDKCPLFFNGKDYFLPEKASPSSHILKFEISGYRNVPIYEYILTKLAFQIGLPVIDIQLKKDEKHYYLLSKRYDRIIVEQQQIKRIHQEDFCQALGISYSKKYQQDGGPSFRDCYQLIQQVSVKPIEDAENLIRWQIFNVLAGNSDGHAKNLSLIYQENNQPQLAPFYDLVCTRAIERVDPKLALSVGGEMNPDKITVKNWEDLASECHMHKNYLLKIIQHMATELLKVISTESFKEDLKKYPAIQRIERIIVKQCNKALNQMK